MSKYDFEIDLSMNTSVGMILSKIKPHSVVLEFGCATGRMTRYMKESLACQVYIVENDSDAFEKAKEFAHDGICDDIQNYRWVERFEGIAFDAIILADVLEHLQDPEDVLKKAAGLLKEDGGVFVSVPNVTHNDVILKTLEERFGYTETGLLDNTHVHFWGLENIKTLGKDAGLTIRSLEATYCPIGCTEQNVETGKNSLLENILRQRQAGEVYQFVLALDKSDSGEQLFAIEPPHIRSHIYLDTGNGFNAQEQFPANAAYSGNGSYLVHHELDVGESVCGVRLDPIEGQGVILRHISICQNGDVQVLAIPNAVQLEKGIYIHSDDPKVSAQLELGGGIVTVDAEFVLPGAQYLEAMEAAVFEKEKRLLQTEQQNKQLQANISDYISLVNQKEKYIIDMEEELRKAKKFSLYRFFACYGKLRAFAGRVLRKIKQYIKKRCGRINR